MVICIMPYPHVNFIKVPGAMNNSDIPCITCHDKDRYIIYSISIRGMKNTNALPCNLKVDMGSRLSWCRGWLLHFLRYHFYFLHFRSHLLHLHPFLQELLSLICSLR